MKLEKPSACGTKGFQLAIMGNSNYKIIEIFSIFLNFFSCTENLEKYFPCRYRLIYTHETSMCGDSFFVKETLLNENFMVPEVQLPNSLLRYRNQIL